MLVWLPTPTVLLSLVISTSGSNSGLINRDNSTVGVGNQTSIRSISSSIVVRSRGIDTSDNSLGSKVLSTGSSNSRLISRSHSSVGVSNKGGDMEGSSISIRSRGSSNNGSSGNSGSSSNNGSSSSIDGGGSYNGGSSSISSVLSDQVVSTGSSYGRLISGDNSSVGVGNKAGDMDGSSIGSGSNGGSSIGSSSNGGSSIGSRGISVSSSISISSSIGMSLESEESRGAGGSNASGKNQKLHVVDL